MPGAAYLACAPLHGAATWEFNGMMRQSYPVYCKGFVTGSQSAACLSTQTYIWSYQFQRHSIARIAPYPVI